MMWLTFTDTVWIRVLSARSSRTQTATCSAATIAHAEREDVQFVTNQSFEAGD
jgi:hypothetical protein